MDAEPALDLAEAAPPALAPPPPESGVGFDLAAVERLVDLGGPVVVLLAILSVAAVAIGVGKLLQFRRAKVWSSREVVDAVDAFRAGDRAGALGRLDGIDTPLARAVRVAAGASFSGDRAGAREATETAAIAEVEELRGGLRMLEFIAGVSPLLGLFGTVLGMIAAFQALEAAGDRVDPAILAGGIWEALFTTAAGLAVAIPALALSNWFERVVDSFAHRIEHQAGRVLTADVAARPAEAHAIAAE